MNDMASRWIWTRTVDPEMVDDLIRDSDWRNAMPGAPAPKRNSDRTRHLVERGYSHVLTIDDRAAATVTVVDDAPFALPQGLFTTARRPLYMQRLAVASWAARSHGALPGCGAVRRAVEVAVDQGADWLRCEVNPDLASVHTMLSAFGFRDIHEILEAGKPRRTCLERPLGP